MNRKKIRVLFVTFLISFCPIMVKAQEVNVEIRGAAFFHSSERFREIYGNVGASYQIEASTPLCNCWDGWVNLDWSSDHDKSKRCDASTRVSITNFSFGIKYPYQFCERYIAYIGIGPSISRVRLKNKSQCEHERISKLAIGGVLKTGIYYFITCNLFVDLFVDYLYQPIHFEKRVDIGGVKTGIGVGAQF